MLDPVLEHLRPVTDQVHVCEILAEKSQQIAYVGLHVQAAMPEPALAINIIMSAAFAVFWADRLNQPQIVLPYQATGYVERGKTLLDIFKRIPTDASQDAALIDAWADSLGIRSWYRWEKATEA